MPSDLIILDSDKDWTLVMYDDIKRPFTLHKCSKAPTPDKIRSYYNVVRDINSYAIPCTICFHKMPASFQTIIRLYYGQ